MWVARFRGATPEPSRKGPDSRTPLESRGMSIRTMIGGSMIASAMVSLALAVGGAGGPAVAPSPPQGQPQIKVWLSSDGDYRFGDQAKAYAKPGQDGYLLVL